MGKHLLQIKTDKWTKISIHILFIICYITISEIYFLVGQVIHHHLKISWVQTWHDRSNCKFSCYFPIVLCKHLVKTLVERWAQPIHAIVYCMLNGLMPVLFGQRIFIINHITNRMTILETSKFAFTITNSKNEITCSFSGFHSSNRFIKSFVPLEYISEDKGERVSKSALFSKRGIRIRHSNLWNS